MEETIRVDDDPVLDRITGSATGVSTWVPSPIISFIPLCRRAPWLASLLFRASAHQKPEKAKDELIKTLGAADARVLAPLPSARISDPYRSAMLHGPHGLIDDYRAFGALEWGFDPAAIAGPVRIWQGEDDTRIFEQLRAAAAA
jgi:hypothetical protein